jgi:hypothetical protein
MGRVLLCPSRPSTATSILVTSNGSAPRCAGTAAAHHVRPLWRTSCAVNILVPSVSSARSPTSSCGTRPSAGETSAAYSNEPTSVELALRATYSQASRSSHGPSSVALGSQREAHPSQLHGLRPDLQAGQPLRAPPQTAREDGLVHPRRSKRARGSHVLLVVRRLVHGR